MNSPDEAPYFCMADTGCRLCKFELEEGDLVVAHLGGHRFSEEFKLRMSDTIHDDYQWINLHTCANPRCMMQGCRVPFFHNDCCNFRIYDISDALVAAGNYTFNPPGYEFNRRFHRIKRLLAPKLRDELQIRLPPETLMAIAGFLVRECATITAEEQSHGTDVSDTAVNLTQGVYVNYTAVDGVRYVKSLNNTASKLCDQDCPILLSRQGETVRKIWIAEDYRGIRFIKLSTTDASLVGPTPIAKSWWRSISVPCDKEQVTIKSDGLKLRDIILCDETILNGAGDFVGWSNPERPNHIIDITTFEQVNSFHERLRMSFFNCNTSGTTGYTAVTCGSSATMIHAHENDGLDFYADMDSGYPRGFFIYMPLDNGEFVTEICRRYALEGGNQISACLVIITNKGRNTLFGISGPPDSCLVLDRIITPAPDGMQIWFNGSTSGYPKVLRYLAVDGLTPPVQRPFPSSLIPNSPYFWTHNTEPYFVSSCSMEGIVDITLCRDMAYAHRPITGILLEYDNGHRECLGQFRFDKSLEKVRVEHATDIYIGSSRTAHSYLYVAHVGISRLHDSEGLSWMRVSRHGTLEWWSSSRHSIVRYTSASGQFDNMAARSPNIVRTAQ